MIPKPSGPKSKAMTFDRIIAINILKASTPLKSAVTLNIKEYLVVLGLPNYLLLETRIAKGENIIRNGVIVWVC